MPMPIGQVNAHLDDGLVMRVGIPHHGGMLVRHALEQGYPAMVSAGAFWDARKGSFRVPECTNLTEADFALDSGGFTAMRLAQKKGPQAGMAGVYPWSYRQYLVLANTVGASWYSGIDMSCEPELVCGPEEIDYRIRATATLLEGSLRILYAWQNELAKTCSDTTVQNLVRPPVPVLQGWSPDSYLHSLELTMDVWERWQPWLAPPRLIGIGSMCRRDVFNKEFGLLAVLAKLDGQLPEGSRAHLYGVKGAVLKHLSQSPWVASVDSMAWDSGARFKALKSGHSNTSVFRCSEMTKWMRSKAQLIAPQFDDDFRLPLAMAA